jgi:hypothetical protein
MSRVCADQGKNLKSAVWEPTLRAFKNGHSKSTWGDEGDVVPFIPVFLTLFIMPIHPSHPQQWGDEGDVVPFIPVFLTLFIMPIHPSHPQQRSPSPPENAASPPVSDFFTITTSNRVVQQEKQKCGVQEVLLDGSPPPLVNFFKKIAQHDSCHAWLSPVLVMPGCHPSLSF